MKLPYAPTEEQIEAARKGAPEPSPEPPSEGSSSVKDQIASLKTVNTENALGINVRHASPQALPKCCSTQRPRAVGSTAGVLECQACHAKFALQNDGSWEFTPGQAEPEAKTPEAVLEEVPVEDAKDELPVQEQDPEGDFPPDFLIHVDDWTGNERASGADVNCYKAAHRFHALAQRWSALVPYDPKDREEALRILVEIASVAMLAAEDLDVLSDYDTDHRVLFGEDEESADQIRTADNEDDGG